MMLLAGLAAVIILLVLILWLRLPPVLALLLVATGVALAGHVPAAAIGPAIEGAMGRTLGHVAIIIALGAMIGRMVDHSGGAEALAGELVRLLGQRRVPSALMLAAFVLGVPVFFEVAVVMLMPIAYKLAHVARRPLPNLAIPMCTTLLAVHAMLPPHPGAVAVASTLGISLGQILMFGLPVAALTALATFLATPLLVRGEFKLDPAVAKRVAEPALAERPDAAPPPAAGLIAALVALPILLIMAGTLAGIVLHGWPRLRGLLVFAGTPYVALMIDVLLCTWLLAARRGDTRATIAGVLAGALPDTALIILTTGAGGAFAQMLVDTGMGSGLSHAMQGTGLPILAIAFLTTLVLRGAQGPATVALLATAGILAPLLQHAGLSSNHLALVALAMGAGAMGLSHVNDAGFWIVTRLTGLNVRQGLTSWTPATTFGGLFAFGTISVLWLLV